MIKIQLPQSALRSLRRAFGFLLLMTLFNCSSPQKNDNMAIDHWPQFTNPETDFYVNEIQPILNRRCVVCHSCNNAPCQLHLDSYEGIRRGATFSDMGSHLLYSQPTRDKDGKNTQEWRTKKFFPVLAETAPPPDENHLLKSSLLYQFVELGQQNNKSQFSLGPVNQATSKDHSCVSKPELFGDFARQFPWAGMPYGLPSLTPSEFDKIEKWVRQGAPAPNDEFLRSRLSSSIPEQIESWESFFNQGEKNRLMARYIYEHVFSAHIHFSGTPFNEWYELVRSKTPFPEAIEELVTERAYDDPKIKTFYYRFKRFTRTISKSSHIPWEINATTRAHYQNLFLESLWFDSKEKPARTAQEEVVKDPGYQSKNPFKYFKQIPAAIRYQFLLENSQLIANAMIRGPACSGKIATHAIRDHFWVFFVKPESDVTVLSPDIGQREWTPLSELNLKDFIEPSLPYTKAMKKYKPHGFALSDLWTGEKKDPDASLTIFRHETNASVHQGLIGGKPPTLWVLNYSNFERIYYNLVVDFLFWGSSAHKAATWTFMSRHRSEAEERFISFLPEKFRDSTRAEWTQGLGSAMNYTQSQLSQGIQSQVTVNDDKNPVGALLLQITQQYSEQQLNPDDQPPNWISLETRHQLKTNKIKSTPDWEDAFLEASQDQPMGAAPFFPDLVFIRIGENAYTLVNHRFYQFNNILALDKLAYAPEKNKVVLLRGLIGDHPDFFSVLEPSSLDEFFNDFKSVKTEAQWIQFRDRYLIRRNNPLVWPTSDWFIDWQWKHKPLDAGVFDLRTYDVKGSF